MLYRSVVGTEPPNHPEFTAFKQGFELPCRNGFNFKDVSNQYVLVFFVLFFH